MVKNEQKGIKSGHKYSSTAHVQKNSEEEPTTTIDLDMCSKGEFTQFIENKNEEYHTTQFTKKVEDDIITFKYSDADSCREVQRRLYSLGTE